MSSSRYNSQNKDLAQRLRKSPTPGENKLWFEVLQGKKLLGYQFNRQFSIDIYIVDFICRKLKLIIEIDGYSHNFKTEEDSIRENKLLSLGYIVLRFQELQVINDLENVIRGLEITIKSIESIPQPPSPRGLDDLTL